MGFNSDDDFRLKLQPAAKRIYSKLFPGSDLEDLRKDGFKVHILDQQFAIDSLLKFRSQQWITVQEKYRRANNWNFHDFTQEYKNGGDTDGEWFHLAAQIYFYGWANDDETNFDHWLLLDVAKFKIRVEKAGGIERVGRLQQNKSWYEGGHGQASFYGLYLKFLRPAILTSYKIFNENGNVDCLLHLKGSRCDKCQDYEQLFARLGFILNSK